LRLGPGLEIFGRFFFSFFSGWEEHERQIRSRVSIILPTQRRIRYHLTLHRTLFHSHLVSPPSPPVSSRLTAVPPSPPAPSACPAPANWPHRRRYVYPGFSFNCTTASPRCDPIESQSISVITGVVSSVESAIELGC